MMPQKEILRMAIQATTAELFVRRRNVGRISDETMQEICEEVENRLRETHLWGFMVDYPQVLPEHILELFFETDEKDWREHQAALRRHEEWWASRDVESPGEYWDNIRHLNY